MKISASPVLSALCVRQNSPCTERWHNLAQLLGYRRDFGVKRFRVEERAGSRQPSLIKPYMHFKRTRLSDVPHAKACTLARSTLINTTEDVAPALNHPAGTTALQPRTGLQHWAMNLRQLA